MKQEVRRQFLHVLFGSIFIALVVLVGTQHTLTVLGLGLLIGVISSYFIGRGFELPLLIPIVQRVERGHETGIPGKGALIFFMGAIVLMLLFREQAIVAGALTVAVFGDAASTLFGIKFGKHRIAGKKTLEGTIGGIIVSALFLGVLFELWIAIAAAIAGMAAELLPMDDSISIPLATAIVLTLL